MESFTNVFIIAHLLHKLLSNVLQNVSLYVLHSFTKVLQNLLLNDLHSFTNDTCVFQSFFTNDFYNILTTNVRYCCLYNHLMSKSVMPFVSETVYV